MKTIIALVLLAMNLYSSNGQQNTKNNKNDTTMIERFDFEDYKKRLAENPLGDFYTEKDGTKVMMADGKNPFIRITSPPPSFITIMKVFHENGVIEMKGKQIGTHVEIGIWQYFDENGKLIKEEDEDKKFGKIKPDDILRFMEKEKYINLSTGAGRFDKDGWDAFMLSFRPGSDSVIVGAGRNASKWYITIWPKQENRFMRTDYEINGETGEVISKKTYEAFPIE
ncbi:hypothetical protein QEG73_22960 [Chitinophagaceae bacterium 26-R-25]|nr:hypothetical protein [Chitinophagaceae bacterium 26-R-25]